MATSVSLDIRQESDQTDVQYIQEAHALYTMPCTCIRRDVQYTGQSQYRSKKMDLDFLVLNKLNEILSFRKLIII